MASSLSDILATIQQGVTALNNLGTQVKGSFNSILSRFVADETNIATNTTSIVTLTSNRVGRVIPRIFTASGTYTPTTGMLYCIIELVGSGGAGGGVTGTAGNGWFVGAGGGSGGYSRVVANAATIGASQVVTVGNAGVGVSAGTGGDGADVSVGAICIGKGGKGGGASNAALQPIAGAGGVAGTGDLAAAGSPGGPGFYDSTAGTSPAGGSTNGGGSSFFGGGATPPTAATGPSNGNAANAYGSGGSGAQCVNSAATSATGGAGSKGVVFITEYVIA